MKKYLLIILVALTTTFDRASAQEKLALNHGAKWQVDQPTAKNVAALRQLVTAGQKADLAEYNRAGVALQKRIGQMIRECHMKGEAHQALHHWLEPLMEQVVRLNKATDEAAAHLAYQQARDQLALFSQYFRS
ncbi:hypothetical protein [Mucilaginibacter boryungensis]|uniref:LTXXQ motif family protein n=1 Tax=Mucilaginibacter boryungensis TaxID=768480 RepID=A0ABR9XD65_9SPHI|nr:hypothetical protein [Mucilaginibacter boryungensis]MBE9665339.1 hypothetical protein [Mucilaginibacter boryungensis]